MTSHTLVLLMVLWVSFAPACTPKEDVQKITTKVSFNTLKFTGIYHGELQAAKSIEVHVPNVPGTYSMTINTVVEDGTRVKKDDVLLTFVRDTMEMDLRDEMDKLQVAYAERRKVAQALARERIDLDLQVERRQIELERAKLAVIEGVHLIAKVDLDKAKLDVQKAELELQLAKKAQKAFTQKRAAAIHVEDLKIEAAERETEQKKKALGMIEIKAPIDGMAYAPYTRLNWQRTKAAPGIVARPGDKVLELPDLSKYHVHMYVRQRDAAFLKVGDQAIVTPLILPNTKIKGTIIKREDFATTRNERLRTERPEDNLKEYLVVVEMEKAPDALRPGNSARVEVSSTLSKKTLTVPLVAINRQEHDKGRAAINTVELVDGSTREIDIGRTTLTYAEVLSGLKEGDEIVISQTYATPTSDSKKTKKPHDQSVQKRGKAHSK